MKIYNNISTLPSIQNAVITIGTFDGVHQGHQKVIEQLLVEAKKIRGSAVVITFYPHPRQVIASHLSPILHLNTLEEKANLLESMGIEHLVVIPFDKTFSEQSANSYIKDFLVETFHPKKIVIGYDHKFGKDRQGDFELLKNKASTYHYEVVEIPAHILSDITISSTKIRNKIMEGKVEEANELLGYNYFFSGLVTHGKKIGRTIGFPTANIEVSNGEKLIPGEGVYVVSVDIAGHEKRYKGMMNIGTRPTFDGTEKKIEVNVFDFDEEIYDQNIIVFCEKKIRDEIKFTNVENLILQLQSDKLTAEDYLKLNH
jgi:riboflavin kinase/FMN adenylyltransferase